MLKILKTAALAAIVGLGALAAMPASAQAQGGTYLGFGSGAQGQSIGFHFSDRGRHDYRGYDRHRPRHQGYRNACSPRDAVRKASRMGLRDVRVVGTGMRTIRVEGKRHGYRYQTMTFANARNCPVLR